MCNLQRHTLAIGLFHFQFLRIQDLGIFIVSHPKFSYDTRDDLEDLNRLGATLLCQRALTNGLHNSEGDVKQFGFWVEKGSKFLKRDIEMLLGIIREYISPSFEDLCLGHDIDPDKGFISPELAPEESTAAEPGIEDDDDFFVASDLKGTVRVKNPYEVEVAILDALKDW